MTSRNRVATNPGLSSTSGNLTSHDSWSPGGRLPSCPLGSPGSFVQPGESSGSHWLVPTSIFWISLGAPIRRLGSPLPFCLHSRRERENLPSSLSRPAFKTSLEDALCLREQYKSCVGFIGFLRNPRDTALSSFFLFLSTWSTRSWSVKDHDILFFTMAIPITFPPTVRRLIFLHTLCSICHL